MCRMQKNVLDIAGPFILHVMNKGSRCSAIPTAQKRRTTRRPVTAPQLLTWVSWPAPQGIIVYRGAYFGLYDTAKGVLFKDEKPRQLLRQVGRRADCHRPGRRRLLPLRHRPPSPHDAGVSHEAAGQVRVYLERLCSSRN